MKNLTILSQTKLDVLYERVCRPINYLAMQISPDASQWDDCIKMCQQIEQDVFAVDSVIKASRGYKGKIQGTSINIYENVLCRVYIILYYLHRDDTLYKEIVFQRLLANIDFYRNNYLKNINEKLDKILSQEKLVEQVLSEKKKNIKPVFEYVDFGRDELDHIYIEYNEELLFREMTYTIKALVSKYNTHQDEATVWYNAKQIVHTFRDINRPELLIERATIALVAGQIYNGIAGSQIILVCAYAMIYASNENSHFADLIKYMDNLSSDVDTKLTLIRDSIKIIKNWLEENKPFDGYDYIGAQGAKNETYTSADIERIRKQIIEQEGEECARHLKTIETLNQQVNALSNERKALEEKIMSLENELDDLDTSEDIEFCDKVRLKLLLMLIKKDGADLDVHGNKAKAAYIMHKIAGLPITTCKNFCSDATLNETYHDEEILKLNSKMQALGMDTRL